MRLGLMKIPKHFPTNAKTIAFCYFEGAVLSVPVGVLLSFIRPFAPPAWTAPIYISAVVLSFPSLLIWSLMFRRDQPFLATIGLSTFIVFTAIIFVGSLFPALS